ncbi:MAG: S-methyl-5-thioribose-1-phosphate isomerase, partial [Candidatus Hadarchaeales archaeon]
MECCTAAARGKCGGMRTIELRGKEVVMIDQTLLPHKVKRIRCKTAEEVARAIEEMRIRGAPALAAAGAMALALAALRSKDEKKLMMEVEAAVKRIKETRPTAVNLFVGVDRVLEAVRRARGVEEKRKAAVETAWKVAEEDISRNRRIGEIGEKVIKDGDCVLTHCNAGALATVDYGTALGVIRSAWRKGKRITVIATETRPLLQGARLTAFELKKEGIPFRVVVDGAVGHLMSRGEVDVVVVGADRIAANGDTANKIGTYTIAILARTHGIPFYVAAPTSTIDPSIKSGRDIPIEYRREEEVASIGGVRVLPKGVKAVN